MKALVILFMVASFPQYVLFIFSTSNVYGVRSVATANFYTLDSCNYAAASAKKISNVDAAYCIRTF